MSTTIKVINATQEVASYNVKKGEVLVIQAGNQINYQLVDDATGFAPQEIIAKRQGNDLVIFLNDGDMKEDIIIKDYYAQDSANMLVGQSENGELYAYVPQSGETAEAISLLSENVIATQSLGGEPVGAFWAFNPWWLAGLLGAGLVAGLAASGGSSGSSSTNSQNPGNNPGNNPGVNPGSNPGSNSGGNSGHNPGNTPGGGSDDPVKPIVFDPNKTKHGDVVFTLDPSHKKAEVTYTPTGAKDPVKATITQGADGTWTSDDPKVHVDPKTGTVTIKGTDIEDNTPVTVTGFDADGRASTPSTTTSGVVDPITFDKDESENGDVVFTVGPDHKTVEVTYTPTGTDKPVTATITKGDDGKWTSNDPKVEVDPNTGKVTIKGSNIEDNTPVTVVAYDDEGRPSKPETITSDYDHVTENNIDKDKTASIDLSGTADDNPETFTITGKSEPGAEITVKDDKGNVIGTATADKDGNYTVVATEKPTNDIKSGDKLTVEAKVPGKSASSDEVTVPAVTEHRGDTVKPTEAKPVPSTEDGDGSATFEVSEDTTKVTVTLTDEDGNEKTVEITRNDDGDDDPTNDTWTSNDPSVDVSGSKGNTVVIDENSVEDHSTVKVVPEDQAGNKGEESSVVVGSDEPKSNENTPNAPTLTANEDGSVTVGLPDNAKPGDTVKVTFTDEKGKENTVTATKQDDGSWKTDPAVDGVTVDGNTITLAPNTVEDGSKVTAFSEDKDQTGRSVTAQTDAKIDEDNVTNTPTDIKVVAVDTSSNADTNPEQFIVTGKVEGEPAGTVVTIKDAAGNIIGQGETDADGNFRIVATENPNHDIKEGEVLTVSAEGENKRPSDEVKDASTTVPPVAADKTGHPYDSVPPSEPTVTVGEDGDNDVTITPPKDLVEGDKVIVTVVPSDSTDGKPVTLEFEKQADGTLKPADTNPTSPKATVNPDGTISIPKDQVKDDTLVTAQTQDVAGQTSDSVSEKSGFDTVTEEPSIESIVAKDTSAQADKNPEEITITGKAPAGAVVIAKDPEGNEIGRTTAGDDGSYTIVAKEHADHDLVTGDQITVVAQKPGEGESKPVTKEVPEVTAHTDTVAPPQADILDPLANGDIPVKLPEDAKEGDTVVVTIKKPDGTTTDVTLTSDGKDGWTSDKPAVIPDVKAEDNNTATIPNDQAPNGTEISVVSKDVAGNSSEPVTENVNKLTEVTDTPEVTSIKAIDTSSPADDNPEKFEITVKVEPGSAVTIKDKDGNVIGTGVDDDGDGVVTVTATELDGSDIKSGDTLTVVAQAPNKLESEAADPATTKVPEVPAGAEGHPGDKTEPTAPTIGEPTIDKETGTGTVSVELPKDAEKGDTVTITVTDPKTGESKDTTVTADGNGGWTKEDGSPVDGGKVDVPVKEGDKVTAVTEDIAGNESKPAEKDIDTTTNTDINTEDNGDVTVDLDKLKPGEEIKIEVKDPTTGDVTGTVVVKVDEEGKPSIDTDPTKTTLPDATIDPETGVVTIPAKDVKDDQEVTVTRKDPETNEETTKTEVIDKPTDPTPLTDVKLQGIDDSNPADDNPEVVHVTGTTAPNAEVTVTDEKGNVIATGKADENGKIDFTFTEPAGTDLKGGEQLTVTAKAADKAPSAPVQEELAKPVAGNPDHHTGDNVAPEAPTVEVEKDGDVTVTITDPKPGDTTVVNIDDPNKPNNPDATVTVTIGEDGKPKVDDPNGTGAVATVDDEGNVVVTIPNDSVPDGSTVDATTTDNAGNPSNPATETVDKPTTTTATPTEVKVEAFDTSNPADNTPELLKVTGKSTEPDGTKVFVKDADGKVIGEGTVQNGEFTIDVNVDGLGITKDTPLQVTAQADDKLESQPAADVTVPAIPADAAHHTGDHQAPDAPVLEASPTDGSVKVHLPDNANPGDKVEVTFTNEDGEKETVTLTKQPNGGWTSDKPEIIADVQKEDSVAVIPENQVKDGEEVNAKSIDGIIGTEQNAADPVNAGSDAKTMTPVIEAITAGDTSAQADTNPEVVTITGKTDPNAEVTVYKDGKPIGTAVAGPDGTFKVEITEGNVDLLNEKDSITVDAKAPGKQPSDVATTEVPEVSSHTDKVNPEAPTIVPNSDVKGDGSLKLTLPKDNADSTNPPVEGDKVEVKFKLDPDFAKANPDVKLPTPDADGFVTVELVRDKDGNWVSSHPELIPTAKGDGSSVIIDENVVADQTPVTVKTVDVAGNESPVGKEQTVEKAPYDEVTQAVTKVEVAVVDNGAQASSDPDKATVTGTLLDKDGKPEVGATVTIKDKDGNVLATGTTNDKGEFNIPIEEQPKDAANPITKPDGNGTVPADYITADMPLTIVAKAADKAEGTSVAQTVPAVEPKEGATEADIKALHPNDTTAPEAPVISTANNDNATNSEQQDGSVTITFPSATTDKPDVAGDTAAAGDVVTIGFKDESGTPQTIAYKHEGGDVWIQIDPDTGAPLAADSPNYIAPVKAQDGSVSVTLPEDKVKDGEDVTATIKDIVGNTASSTAVKAPFDEKTDTPVLESIKAYTTDADADAEKLVISGTSTEADGTVITLLDAAGKPINGKDGNPITTTVKEGKFTFTLTTDPNVEGTQVTALPAKDDKLKVQAQAVDTKGEPTEAVSLPSNEIAVQDVAKAAKPELFAGKDDALAGNVENAGDVVIKPGAGNDSVEVTLKKDGVTYKVTFTKDTDGNWIPSSADVIETVTTKPENGDPVVVSQPRPATAEELQAIKDGVVGTADKITLKADLVDDNEPVTVVGKEAGLLDSDSDAGTPLAADPTPLTVELPKFTAGEDGSEMQGGAVIEPGSDNVKMEISFKAEDTANSPVTITLEKRPDGTWTYKVEAPALSGADKEKLLSNIEVDPNGKVTLKPDAILDEEHVTVKGFDAMGNESKDAGGDVLKDRADELPQSPTVTAAAKGEMFAQPGDNNTSFKVEYTKPDGSTGVIELEKKDGQWLPKGYTPTSNPDGSPAPMPELDYELNTGTGGVTFLASTKTGENTVTATGSLNNIDAVTKGEAIFDTTPNTADAPNVELSGTDVIVRPGDDNTTLTVKYNPEGSQDDVNDPKASIVLEFNKERGVWESKGDLPQGVKLDEKTGALTLPHTAVQDGGKVVAEGANDKAVVATSNDNVHSPVINDHSADKADAPVVTPNDDGSVTISKGGDNERFTVSFVKEEDDKGSSTDTANSSITAVKNPQGEWTLVDSNGLPVSASVATIDKDNGTVTLQATAVEGGTTVKAVGTDAYNNTAEHTGVANANAGASVPAPVAGVPVFTNTAVGEVHIDPKGNKYIEFIAPVKTDNGPDASYEYESTADRYKWTFSYDDSAKKWIPTGGRLDPEMVSTDSNGNLVITTKLDDNYDGVLISAIPSLMNNPDYKAAAKLTDIKYGTNPDGSDAKAMINPFELWTVDSATKPDTIVEPVFGHVTNDTGEFVPGAFTLKMPEGKDGDVFKFNFNLGLDPKGNNFRYISDIEATFTKVNGVWQHSFKSVSTGQEGATRFPDDSPADTFLVVTDQDGVYTIKGKEVEIPYGNSGTIVTPYLLSKVKTGEIINDPIYTRPGMDPHQLPDFNLIGQDGTAQPNPHYEGSDTPTETAGIDELADPLIVKKPLGDPDQGGMTVSLDPNDPNVAKADTLTVNYTNENNVARTLVAKKDPTSGKWAFEKAPADADISIAEDGTITFGHDALLDYSKVTATVSGADVVPASKTEEADKDPLPEYIKNHTSAVVVPEDVFVYENQSSSQGMNTLINYAKGWNGLPAHGEYLNPKDNGVTSIDNNGVDYTINLTKEEGTDNDKQFIIVEKSFGRSPTGGVNDHNVILNMGDGGDTLVIGNNLGYYAPASDSSTYNRNSYIDMGKGDDLLVVGGSNYDFDVSRNKDAFNGIGIVHSPDDSRKDADNDVGEELVNLKKIAWADKDGGIINHAVVRMGEGDDTLLVLGSSNNTATRLAIRDSFIDLGNGNNQLEVSDYTVHFNNLYQQRRGEIGDNTFITAGDNSNNYVKAHRIGGGSSIVLKDGKDYVEFNDVMDATINTGAGDDTVRVKDELQGSTILLGDGNDTFEFGGYYLGAKVLSGGAGIDTLKFYGNPDGSGYGITNGSMANVKGFEIIQMGAGKVLDITYDQLASDTSRTGPLKIQKLGQYTDKDFGAIDLGSNNWNSDAFNGKGKANFDAWGSKDGNSKWVKGAAVVEDDKTYDVYHYESASNTLNDVWIERGIEVI
ncbi:hypothetical protein BMT54_06950 [Pasteurellaceae bacterium 15-036681]|nr:hypothetical protein BMT54_06950 [Pasteurellaceae bacterium 15-036681]